MTEEEKAYQELRDYIRNNFNKKILNLKYRIKQVKNKEQELLRNPLAKAALERLAEYSSGVFNKERQHDEIDDYLGDVGFLDWDMDDDDAGIVAFYENHRLTSDGQKFYEKYSKRLK